MADYIDRDLFAREVNRLSTHPLHTINGWDTGSILLLLDSIPPADVRENVHGEWKKTNPHLGHEYIWHCSNCGQDCMETIMGKPKWNFCPNCGSRMR